MSFDFDCQPEMIRFNFGGDKSLEMEITELKWLLSDLSGQALAEHPQDADRAYFEAIRGMAKERAEAEITLGQAERIHAATQKAYDDHKKKERELLGLPEPTDSSPASPTSSESSTTPSPESKPRTSSDSDEQPGS